MAYNVYSVVMCKWFFVFFFPHILNEYTYIVNLVHAALAILYLIIVMPLKQTGIWERENETARQRKSKRLKGASVKLEIYFWNDQKCTISLLSPDLLFARCFLSVFCLPPWCSVSYRLRTLCSFPTNPLQPTSWTRSTDMPGLTTERVFYLEGKTAVVQRWST